MASAQVLSNSSASSRKDHLEAGKRRLEEFRKKKAAAKKAASTTQPRPVVSSSDDKQALENGQAPFGSSVSAAGGGKTDTVTESSSFLDLSSKSYDYSRDSGSESIPAENVNHKFLSSDSLQMEPKQEGNSYGFPGLKSHSGFIYSEQTDDRVKNVETGTGEGRYADGVSSARLNAPHDNSGYFGSVFGVEQSHSDKDVSISRRFPGTYSRISDISAEVYADGHASDLLNNESDSAKPAMEAFTSDLGRSQHGAVELKNHEERKPSIAVDNLSRFYSQQASESLSVGFNSDISGSYNGPAFSATAETYPKRSRPSFLDSLNIDREPMASSRPYSEKEKSTTSNFSSSDMVASFGTQDHSTSSAPLEPLPTPVPSNPSTDFFSNPFRGQKVFENSLETNLESNSHKQNEDFAALEQHIEDLTQEKFSLQRTLEASKTLAESLAAENSSLTESYNQQASIVNQLRAEMENLQSEIKARLVELESFKAEYMNAQLECNAADERAKLLASEVIGLEEKALRLRSNELKLQRELENSSAELASYKKKLSSLEKERRDLMQTIDALQEEKKLLQTKFRKASASGISMDINKGHEKKDVSTSTNDLGLDTTGADGDSFEQASSNVRGLDDTDNVLLLAQNRSAGSEDSALSIPPDQMQMIQNINSLISEIMAEKEELVQALMTEVSTSTKLKELNKELLQKLEIQTQRLELLTSQNMANENIPTKQPTVSHVVRETVAYADEGDEVVERVLGWIMKLFPGGPSRRRSSRF